MRRAKIQTEDGTILRAYLHSPGPGAHPGIVMCPGFGGVKPHIDPYAALFAEAGFAVLNFDNRGWGTSEGEPRQELNVFKQITDLRDAITFAESQPEFDSEQGFGVWGSSFSGGLAIVTAANDPRVRCVVAQIPNVSGHRNAVKLFTAEQLHEIRRRAAIDRLARLAGEPPMMVPMFSEDPDELCAFPGEFPEEYREAIESGIWNNQTTIRSLENFIEFEPAGLASLHHTQAAADDPRRTRSMHLHRGSARGVRNRPGAEEAAHLRRRPLRCLHNVFRADRTPGSRLVRRAPGGIAEPASTRWPGTRQTNLYGT